MSFHATKAFATGEGGCVASTDTGVVEQVGQALNFGFAGSRDSATPSLNGKLSEYHAAVGLAELEQWDAKQEATARVLDLYRARFDGLGLADRLSVGPRSPRPTSCFRRERNSRRTTLPEVSRKTASPTGSGTEEAYRHTPNYRGPLVRSAPCDGEARAPPPRASLCRRSRRAGCRADR